MEPTAIATASSPPIDEAACQLLRLPGPADRAPTEGDLADWSNTFGGRWRLCLGGPNPLEIEGTAWCIWTARRDTVREISGLPIDVDAVTGRVDGGVSLERRVAYLAITRPSGDIGSYEGGPSGQEIRGVDRGQRGIVSFDVHAIVDPEHPPAVVPPGEVGLMRWACLDPAPA